MKNEISIPVLRDQVEVKAEEAVAFMKDPKKLEKSKAQVLADLNAQVARKWRETRAPGNAPKLTDADVQFSITTAAH
ncbi:MAG: hypothetical protein ACXWCO_03380 [Caldimonas sp.]